MVGDIVPHLYERWHAGGFTSQREEQSAGSLFLIPAFDSLPLVISGP